MPGGTIFFPELLRKAGYETAFVGKWHMGHDHDDPRPGFDHWVSFRGQGNYLPSGAGLNVNGKRVLQKGYITDELTDYAIEWLEGRSGEKPFFLYYATGAGHAPHHVEPEWIEKYKGKFDMGWDKVREKILQQQIAKGVVPADTKLTKRIDQIPNLIFFTPMGATPTRPVPISRPVFFMRYCWEIAPRGCRESCLLKARIGLT